MRGWFRKWAFVALLISTPAYASSDIVLHRDPGCGCCMKWAAQVQAAFGRNVQVIEDASRGTIQRKAGLPANLVSCHTAIIDGMVFEGHVPVADMKRVLATRPKGVRGLAVAGMPLGSPGMEVPGRVPDRYSVFAFGAAKPVVFARH